MTVYGKDLWLLQQITDRIIQKAGYSKSSCFICDIEVPDLLPATVPICTVCLGPEQYDEGTFNGAGPNALAMYGTILITVIQSCLLDSVPKTTDALVHSLRGLLPLKQPIMRALFLTDTEGWQCEGHRDVWVPEIDGQSYLIERGLVPRGWSRPAYADRNGKQYLATTLTVQFGLDQEI